MISFTNLQQVTCQWWTTHCWFCFLLQGSFAEVQVYSLGVFAVVSCLKRESFTVSPRGLSLKLPMDPRVCLSYLPGCFAVSVMAQTMVQALHCDRRQPELVQRSSILDFWPRKMCSKKNMAKNIWTFHRCLMQDAKQLRPIPSTNQALDHLRK